MNKMKKVPKIRFEEFAEDWENTDASIIFKTYFDKNHPDLPVLSIAGIWDDNQRRCRI